MPPLTTLYNLSRKKESEEIQNILDHLLAVGMHNRHNAWRIKEHFESQQRNKRKIEDIVNDVMLETAAMHPLFRENETTVVDGSSSSEYHNEESSVDESQLYAQDNGRDGRLVHAEDARVYGNRVRAPRGGFEHARKKSKKRVSFLRSEETNLARAEPYLWPARCTTGTDIKQQRKFVDDHIWEIEHGDQVDEVDFIRHRLSTHRDPPPCVMPVQDHKLDNLGKRWHWRTSIPELLTDNNPFVIMLQRCWNRAMQAAATIAVDTTTPMSHPIDATSSLTLSREEAMKLCAKYQIAVPDISWKKSTCPRCGADFDDLVAFNDHFYGSSSTRGCCWEYIWNIECKGIQSALEDECSAQLKQITRWVFSRLSMTATNDKFNWESIIDVVQKTLASQQRVSEDQAPPPPVQEHTLEIEKGARPILLNDFILKRVRDRLVLRYADVPK